MIVLLVLIFTALLANVAVVAFIGQRLTQRDGEDLFQIHRAGRHAERQIGQITADGMQAMIDEALHELRSRE